MAQRQLLWENDSMRPRTINHLVIAGLLSLSSVVGQQPAEKSIFVAGRVKTPGRYSFAFGSNTVLSVIAQANGLNRNSAPVCFIYRRDETGVQHQIAVQLRDVMSGKLKDIELQPGDTLYVPEATSPRREIAPAPKWNLDLFPQA
jgi:protein involved in polysaccharide export with SLBB domain